MSVWSSFLNWLTGPVLPDADTTRITNAINALQSITPQEGRREMTTPTPDDLREISQSVIDGWASAIESAVTRLRTALQQPNVPQAVVTGMTQAITDLEGVGQPPATP